MALTVRMLGFHAKCSDRLERPIHSVRQHCIRTRSCRSVGIAASHLRKNEKSRRGGTPGSVRPRRLTREQAPRRSRVAFYLVIRLNIRFYGGDLRMQGAGLLVPALIRKLVEKGAQQLSPISFFHWRGGEARWTCSFVTRSSLASRLACHRLR